MKPALVVKAGRDLPLSGDSLTDLMKAVLAKGKPFRFRARGFSMSPFIKDGDMVTIRPPDGASPRTGDVAAFIHPESGKAAVHRVVREKSGRFSLKGDNTFEADGDLAAGDILGIVSKVERNGRTVRLGSGPGGSLIAFLSRSGWLAGILRAARRALRPGTGRS